jgi:1,4-dihydroxy-2-naphthoate octaprenyltransferase
MKLYQLSFTALMLRFYLMMAIIIIAGFSGIWLLSLLALPVFFSGLMGLQFSKLKAIKKTHRSGRPDLRTTGRQVTAHA